MGLKKKEGFYVYKQITIWKKSCHLSKKEKEEAIENIQNFILIMSNKDITEIIYNTQWVSRIIVDSNGNQSTIYPKKPTKKGIEEKLILKDEKAIAQFFFRKKFPLSSIKQLTFIHQI